METKPVFMQKTFNFKGQGLETAISIEGLSYTVPENTKSQLVYFRAGNSADDLVNLTLLRDGELMRLFPIGMKSSMHFPLAIQEFLPAGTVLELVLSAPDKLPGSIFVDIGLMEHVREETVAAS